MFYIWVTNNLKRRINEHKNKINQCFTNKYNIDKLVYFEKISHILEAIKREKQIKWWTRKKKIFLVNQINAERKDLSSLIYFD